MSNSTKKKKVVASKPASPSTPKPLKKKKKRLKPTAQESKPVPKVSQERYEVLSTKLFALRMLASDLLLADIKGQDVGLPRTAGYNKPITKETAELLNILLTEAMECAESSITVVCEQWKKDYPNGTIPKRFTQIAERYANRAVSG